MPLHDRHRMARCPLTLPAVPAVCEVMAAMVKMCRGGWGCCLLCAGLMCLSPPPRLGLIP